MELDQHSAQPTGGDRRVFDEAHEWLQAHWDPALSVGAWWEMLADSGWGYPTWPTEWFGRQLPGWAVRQVRDAFAEIGALGPPVRAGQRLAAPTLLTHGSEEQKRRFVPELATGREQWSQFFSEPGAGSDLAAVQTRATQHGNEWIVNGQKVWNSFAQYSSRGILLARTNIDVPKHAGLTFFIIDVDQPGVEIRPLRQMNGNSDFNEVFFSDARIPADRVVGGVGNGWKVALTTLGFERFMTVGSTSVLPGAKAGYLHASAGDAASGALDSPGEGTLVGRMTPVVLAAARARGIAHDPLVRQRIAELDVLERVFAAMSARNDASVAAGGAGVSGSVLKLIRSQLAQLGRDVGLAVLGAYGLLSSSAYSSGVIEHFALTSPYSSIAGGTDEIQLNIVGERLLGLPRGTTPDRNVAFRDLRTTATRAGDRTS